VNWLVRYVLCILPLQMIDLRERKLLHHGTLVWKINAGRLIDVYMLLLDTHIVLLERKETRYILRQQNAAIGGDQFLYSPVVDLPGMIVRLNAGGEASYRVVHIIRFIIKSICPVDEL
jgi:hypothetical protein